MVCLVGAAEVHSWVPEELADFSHLLMSEVSRGNRAAVRVLERPVADPHSMAFSYRTTGNPLNVKEAISAICNLVLDGQASAH